MSDRDMTTCDRCTQAHVAEWWKPEGRLTVLLCNHHDREHGPALELVGFTRYEPIREEATT